MAEGLSAVATKALPRAIATGSWFGSKKPMPRDTCGTRMVKSNATNGYERCRVWLQHKFGVFICFIFSTRLFQDTCIGLRQKYFSSICRPGFLLFCPAKLLPCRIVEKRRLMIRFPSNFNCRLFSQSHN